MLSLTALRRGSAAAAGSGRGSGCPAYRPEVLVGTDDRPPRHDGGVPAPSPRSPGRGTGTRLRVLLIALLVVVVAGFALARAGRSGSLTSGNRSVSTPGAASTSTDPESGSAWVDESRLSDQAKETLSAIRHGGPFRYPKNDGVAFDNREGLLPPGPKGSYREYTVVTPGSPDRGPRRIITASGGAKFFTGDHYASFQRIREGS